MNKTIAITMLSLIMALSFGVVATYASEITGTLSSSGVLTGTTNTTSGSLSGSVSGGSVISGSVGGNNSSGGGGSSGSSRNSLAQVLGASTDVPIGSYPGLPSTGRAK